MPLPAKRLYRRIWSSMNPMDSLSATRSSAGVDGERFLM